MFNRLLLTLILFLLMSVQSVNAQVLSGADVETATINQISNFLDERGDMRRREVKFLRHFNDTTIPDGQASLEVILPGKINYTGMTSIAIKCRVDGRICKVINFTVKVNVYDVVLVAAHDLTFDKPITEADFRQEEVAIDGRSDYIKDFSVIKTLVPARLIRAGSPVTINLFRTAMVIKANQPVRIRIKYHGVEASAKGFALTRGRVGDMIRVKNESSGKILTGKVIDEQTVEVIY